jgi:hypothetical protein
MVGRRAVGGSVTFCTNWCWSCLPVTGSLTVSVTT